MSDLKDELEQERREKEWAETWKPQEPGDMLIGTLEGYDQATTDFGTYRVAHIRDEEGVLRGLWLMHNVLQDEWEEAAPEVGERVGVQYHGKRSGENYDYHMWAAKVDRKANAGDEAAGEDAPQTSDEEGRATTEDENAATAGGDRAPKDSRPDFPGDELFGEPAAESETDGGESTLDDPNGGLPY
ncbi:hypothetical protein [Salinibacter ruber]|uniref:hypothetical protein n=1 Tax=Salinibacter ruber TaxID=146919 RepID=UPI002169F379|nr:hypothetical protein [Salinibacter ruber]MCS4185214.1 hypothetical protein [Salinibacter ruber]